MRTGAPKKGVDQRSEVIGQLSSDVFKMTVSEEMARYIAVLSSEEAKQSIDRTTAIMMEKTIEEYERNKKIPADEYREFVVLRSKSESAWEEAREKGDFSIFQPYLEQVVSFTRKFTEYWGYEENPYNTLLDMYEPGVTVSVLDEVFAELREKIVPLVKAISESSHKPETSFLFKHFPKEAQKSFKSLNSLDMTLMPEGWMKRCIRLRLA